MRSQFATIPPPFWSPTVPLFKNPETGVFSGFRVYAENAMPKANKKQNNKQPNKQGVLASLPLASCSSNLRRSE
jgi:hypothetical protein